MQKQIMQPTEWLTKHGVIGTQQIKPFETAISIADYYGFKPINTVYDRKCTSWKDCVTQNERHLIQDIYLKNKAQNINYPMFYNIKVGKSENKEFCLSVFNTKKSIAEALIIQTSISILNEYGHKGIFVDINSLGDNRSFSTFLKDLYFYYKKNTDFICSYCKNKYQKNIFKLFDCKNEKCNLLREDAPKPISYLNDEQIKHFKEVLEYLESTDVPYKINNNLITHGSGEGFPNIVFQIKKTRQNENEENESILAKGERCEHFLKNIKNKKRVPSVYTSLNLLNTKKISKNNQCFNKKHDKKIYFVHVGHEARLQSLYIIENLRRKRIPILQSIIEDGLIKQMSEAENTNVTHTIIMGVKEVREKYVIVRNMETHSQESISIENLPVYLKRVVK
ncbi:hypothetical protein KJ991_00620 [Patescibacteria group bacterium]|nr:hypothetical protein [Patescibacteria group bacterium]